MLPRYARSQVIEALRPHNLTLPNLASISAQQIGGFVSAGAHGTGASIPPVDDFVLDMTLVTPRLGCVRLSRSDSGLHKLAFNMVRVGLGAFGVAAEYTLSCVPAHDLLETTTVMTRGEAVENLPRLIKEHKHMRYMWIPYEDAVVVVTNDPASGPTTPSPPPPPSDRDPLGPLRSLLLSASADLSPSAIETMGMGELRDALLDIDPLDVEWVKKVNKVEHEFWKRVRAHSLFSPNELLMPPLLIRLN